MKYQIVNAILICVLFQSCASNKKTSIRLEESVGKGKTLVVFKNGQKESFDHIEFQDSSYYGINNKSSAGSQSQLITDDETSQIFLSKPNASNNVISASFNGYIMSGPALSIIYERKIAKSFWFSTGIGGYPMYENSGKKADFKLTYLTGKKNSHLELGFGVMYSWSKAGESQVTQAYGTIPATPAYKEVDPAITIGYRYQNPGDGFVFRVGVGFYDVYIGLGLRF